MLLVSHVPRGSWGKKEFRSGPTQGDCKHATILGLIWNWILIWLSIKLHLYNDLESPHYRHFTDPQFFLLLEINMITLCAFKSILKCFYCTTLNTEMSFRAVFSICIESFHISVTFFHQTKCEKYSLIVGTDEKVVRVFFKMIRDCWREWKATHTQKEEPRV